MSKFNQRMLKWQSPEQYWPETLIVPEMPPVQLWLKTIQTQH